MQIFNDRVDPSGERALSRLATGGFRASVCRCDPCFKPHLVGGVKFLDVNLYLESFFQFLVTVVYIVVCVFCFNHVVCKDQSSKPHPSPRFQDKNENISKSDLLPQICGRAVA